MQHFISAIMASAFCMAAISGCKNIVTFENLPAEAQTFLTENFSDFPVSYAVKECNEYDVILTDGTEIEFNGKGEWKTVEMKHKSIPAAVLATLPPSVSSYLTTSFGNVPVEKVEKGFCPAYKAELVNGLDVYFNSKGICTKVDD